jgi:hypothetical protein
MTEETKITDPRITASFRKDNVAETNVYNQIMNDADEADRPAGQYLRIWLRDHYVTKESVQTQVVG